MNEFVARIRWGNIGRIAGVLAGIALVVAWPRLKSEPPKLPPANTVQAQPADPLTPANTQTTVATTTPAPVPAAVERPAEVDSKPRRHRRKRRHHKVASPAAQPTPPVYRPAPPVRFRPRPAPQPEFQSFG